MSDRADEYRVKIVNDILSSVSHDEVKFYAESVVGQLEEYNLNEQEVALFVDEMLNELALFSPIKKDAQQWSNINLAKILFHRMRNELDKAVNDNC